MYLISKHFLSTPQSINSIESKVFYSKTIADSFRYLAYFEQSQIHLEKLRDEGEKRYKVALFESIELEATHPLKLATALNFSVFLYEIRFEVHEAIDIANKYLKESVVVFSTLE